MAALRQDSADPAFRRATHARQSLDPRHWSYPSPRPPRGSLRPAHFRRSRASGRGPWDQSSDRCGMRRSNQADTESRGVLTEFRGAGSIRVFGVRSRLPCFTLAGEASDRGVACDRQAPRLRGTPCELRKTPCPLDCFQHPARNAGSDDVLARAAESYRYDPNLPDQIHTPDHWLGDAGPYPALRAFIRVTAWSFRWPSYESLLRRNGASTPDPVRGRLSPAAWARYSRSHADVEEIGQ
jgi:hypothetical protein